MGLLALILAFVFPPCATEDAMNCVWDAGASGNGVGVSFVDVAGTAYEIPWEG